MRAPNIVWGVVALCAASLDSMAQPAPSAKPTASVSATADAKVEIPPWPEKPDLPAFDHEPFGDEKTKTPDADDWKAAKQVRLSRVSRSVPSGCRAWRVREWMKIHCDLKTAGLRMLAGKSEGVSLVISESLVSEKEAMQNPELFSKHFETMGRIGQIVFPVRRGDRRVFEWLSLEIASGYDSGQSAVPRSTMILEEQWLDGDKPYIALLWR